MKISYNALIALTVRDTLVVTRVDTLVIKPEKPKIPLEFDVHISAYHGAKKGGLRAFRHLRD